MNQINLPISQSTIGGVLVPTVDGRVLRAGLNVSKDFSSWAKAQVKRARLVEGRDYLLTQKGEQLPSGMKYLIDYHFTIEAAKHIAMMCGTDKGFEVRDYFIECERRLNAKQDPAAFLNDPNVLRVLLLENVEARIAAEKRADKFQIKAIAFDAFASEDGVFGIQQAARQCNKRDDTLVDILTNPEGLHWLFRDREKGPLKVCRPAERAGFVTTRRGAPRITSKGLNFLLALFASQECPQGSLI